MAYGELGDKSIRAISPIGCLTGGVWTSNLEEGERIASQLDVAWR